MSDEIDLLDIPDFLRRTNQGADTSRKHRRRARRNTNIIRVSEVLDRWKPHRPNKTLSARLRKLGWSSGQVAGLTPEEAAFYVEKRFGPRVRFAAQAKTEA